MTLQRWRIVLIAAALASAVACGGSSGITNSNPGPGDAALASKAGPSATGTQDRRLPPGLDSVLRREYFALTLYQGVIDELQAGRPFTSVVLSEVQHVARLEELYTKRELAPPDPPEQGPILVMVRELSGIVEACGAAAELEKQLGSDYSSLLARELPRDVARVLDHLKAATLDNHLVAFERCARR